MCYNCGCDMPDDDMGKGNVKDGGGSLTDVDFEHVAKAWDMTVEDTKRETYKLLKKELGEE